MNYRACWIGNDAAWILQQLHKDLVSHQRVRTGLGVGAIFQTAVPLEPAVSSLFRGHLEDHENLDVPGYRCYSKFIAFNALPALLVLSSNPFVALASQLSLVFFITGKHTQNTSELVDLVL